MSLSRYSIIVAVDNENGMACRGTIPWSNRSLGQFFRETTMGDGKVAIVMGRVTYETVLNSTPLEGRHCFVISRKWRQESVSGITVSHSIAEALSTIGSTNRYSKVFFVGGGTVFRELIHDYLYLCDEIIVSKLKTIYDCDQLFPWSEVSHFKYKQAPQKSVDYTRYFFNVRDGVHHPEYEYLSLLNRVLESKEQIVNGDGSRYHRIFEGERLVIDTSDGRVPIFTTRKIDYAKEIKKFIFWMNGRTNNQILQSQGVECYTKYTTEEHLKGTDYESGDLGPTSGFIMRYSGAAYEDCKYDYTDHGCDQLNEMIKLFNDGTLDTQTIQLYDLFYDTVVPRNEISVQFNVTPNKKYIDLHVSLSEVDVFCELPELVVKYLLLHRTVAHLCNIQTRKLIFTIGRAFIQQVHSNKITRQLKRTPFPFPTLKLRKASRVRNLQDFTSDTFIVEGYTSGPPLLE